MTVPSAVWHFVEQNWTLQSHWLLLSFWQRELHSACCGEVQPLAASLKLSWIVPAAMYCMSACYSSAWNCLHVQQQAFFTNAIDLKMTCKPSLDQHWFLCCCRHQQDLPLQTHSICQSCKLCHFCVMQSMFKFVSCTAKSSSMHSSQHLCYCSCYK